MPVNDIRYRQTTGSTWTRLPSLLDVNRTCVSVVCWHDSRLQVAAAAVSLQHRSSHRLHEGATALEYCWVQLMIDWSFGEIFGKREPLKTALGNTRRAACDSSNLVTVIGQVAVLRKPLAHRLLQT